MSANERDGVLYARPASIEERRRAALECANRLGVTMPVLLDGMENEADLAFGAWPERLYVIGTEGRIAYQGGKGPYGFDPDELARFLSEHLDLP